MEELAKRKDTIIINVNKGDDILITHVKKYINKANCQLSVKPNYMALQEDQMLQHSKLVNDKIDIKKESLLSKKLADGLKCVNPKVLHLTQNT